MNLAIASATLKHLQRKRQRIAPKVNTAIHRSEELQQAATKEKDEDGAVSTVTAEQLKHAERQVKELLDSISKLDLEIPKAEKAGDRKAEIAKLVRRRAEIAKSTMRTRELFEGAVDEMATLRPLLVEFTSQAKRLGFGTPSSLADGRMLQRELDATRWRSDPRHGPRPHAQMRKFRIGEHILSTLDVVIRRAKQNGDG